MVNDVPSVVTVNLANVLRQLRSQTQIQKTWVDALYINQDDR